MVMRLRILLLWMVIATPLSRSADPAWWSTRGVTNQNPAANLAPATIGQAKHMAAMALAELDGKLPTHQSLVTDLGQIVNLSLPDPLPAGFHEQQRAALLTGQLKAMAKPFYDHLRAHDAAWLDNAMANAQIVVMEPGIYPATRSPYPWSESTTDDANRAPATLGQLKAVFSLPFEALPSTPPAIVDTDGDGMPDAWEILYGLNSNDSNDANGDLDGDGISNIREYQLGLSPTEHNEVGIQNAGTQVEDGEGNILSFRDEYPSDLYLQDSIPGWQAVEGEYIEVWDEGDGNVYAELQSHFEAKGIKQEFNLLPGESFTFLLRYKGRYENFDDSNPFTLKVEGAHRLLVDEEPARQTGDAWEASFMEDDNWDTLPYEDWHYATVVIESDPAATTLEEITLSLIPDDLDPEITHGGFVSLLPMRMEQVRFAGEKYHQLKKDDLSKNYSVPQWMDIDGNGIPAEATDGERNNPVAYTCNTKPSIGARFRIQGLPDGLEIWVKASGSDGIEIPETQAVASGESLIIPETPSTNNWPDRIKFYDRDDPNKAFTLNWKIRLGNGNWAQMASTKHQVYLTWADPLTTLRQETLFEIGSRRADGETEGEQARIKAYAEFQTRAINRVSDQTPLIYWANPPARGAVTTTELLARPDGDGNCNAWSQFFRDILRVQGIEANMVVVIPIIVETPPLLTPNSDKLVAVKEWTFLGEGIGTVNYPYISGVDAIPGNGGVAGQNNPSPPKSFNLHYVTLSGGTIYDPSYGTPPVETTIKAYEDAAFAGFGKKEFHDNVIRSLIAVNHDGAVSPAEVQILEVPNE